MANPTLVIAVLAALVFLGMGLEELFRRTGIPDVLILLLLGLAGSLMHLVDLSGLGHIEHVFTHSALVLILFEGAVRLRVSELKRALAGSLAITLISFIATTGILAAIGATVFGMRPLAAVMLGCILGGTSSAVVIPMAANLKVQQTTKTILTLESALSDVVCIVFTLALTSALSAGEVQWGEVGINVAWGLGGSVLIGLVAGFAWSVLLRGIRKKRASVVAVAAAVFIVYAVAEGLGTFGAISCLAFGIVLGNAELFSRKKVPAEELGLPEGERLFIADSAFLLKVFFFVYLGATLNLAGFEPLVYGGLATVAIFAIRPIAVRLSTRPKKTVKQDAVIASAIAPKGLAAAVLATVPVQAKIAEGHVIQSITFGVILFSIILTSVLTIFARKAFIAEAYGKFFGKYLPSPDAATAPAAAATTGAEVIPVATAPESSVAPEEPANDSTPPAANGAA